MIDGHANLAEFSDKEKLIILFKNSMRFPTTRLNTNWFSETNIKYNNYVFGNEIFLDEIPTDPSFTTPRSAGEVGLTEKNFINYNSNESILEDSTRTVRRYSQLKLKNITNIISGSSTNAYHQDDADGNEVLADGIQFNVNADGGNKPYLYQLYYDDGTPNLSELGYGQSSGNYVYNFNFGCIFFPDEIYNADPHPLTSGKISFTFYKYIGRKGIRKLLTEPRRGSGLYEDASFNNVRIIGKIFDASGDQILGGGDLTNGEDASFNNVDISGTVTVSKHFSDDNYVKIKLGHAPAEQYQPLYNLPSNENKDNHYGMNIQGGDDGVFFGLEHYGNHGRDNYRPVIVWGDNNASPDDLDHEDFKIKFARVERPYETREFTFKPDGTFVAARVRASDYLALGFPNNYRQQNLIFSRSLYFAKHNEEHELRLSLIHI